MCCALDLSAEPLRVAAAVVAALAADDAAHENDEIRADGEEDRMGEDEEED